MYKKLMLACMAIAAFGAFVIAPTASATTLTSEGKVVPTGTSITALNTGITKFTGSFSVECDHDHLVGTVTQNNTTKIKGEIALGGAKFNGTATGTDCTSALGASSVTVNSKLCLETTTEDKLSVTGCGANIVFTLEVTGTGPCKYSTSSISGTYTTNQTPVTVTFSEQKAVKSEGGFFCPAEGKLDLEFDLYTTSGVGLTIS